MPNSRNSAWGGDGGDGTYTPVTTLLTSADISDGTITSADIADGTITSVDIADGGIKNADLVSSAGTLADMPPSRELSYVQFTSPVTVSASSEATANTVVTAAAVTFDNATPVIIEFFSPEVVTSTTANDIIAFWLYDGASSIGTLGICATPAAGSLHAPAHAVRRLTPSAASHTYSVRASRSSANGAVNAGTGVLGANAPGFIRIVKA